MHKCKICGKIFKRRISLERHITVLYGKEKEKKHCPILYYKWKYEGDIRFSKSSLKKMYLTEMKSTPMIKEELNINKITLLNMMRYYGIKLRNISECAKNQIKRDGLWNKGLTKYDHESIMKCAKKRMGKNNPYYTAPNFEERKKKNLEIIKKAHAMSTANRNPKTTERRMAKILDENDVCYLRNFSLNYYENGKKKWRLFDFLIENILLIEMNGNYYHANPKIYKKDDMVNFHNRKVKAKEIWEYDAKKMKLGKDSSYNTLVLWEDEFVRMTDKEAIIVVNNSLNMS